MSEMARLGTIASVVTKLEALPAVSKVAFVEKVVTLQMSAAKSEGFWSGEIVPPAADSNIWSIIQRFENPAHLHGWRSCLAREQILKDITSGSSPVGRLHGELTVGDDTEAATAIVTHVRPGMEEKYFDWETRIQVAQAGCDGYRGAYLQPPSPGHPNQWATLLRFNSPAALDAWFKSDRRQELLGELDQFVIDKKFRPISSSFPGWVPLDLQGSAPPNWKTALLVLLGLFPIVMLEMKFISPHLNFLNPALSGFITMIISVSATTFFTMPYFVQRFRWWLFPSDEEKSEATLKGSLILAALFAIEVALSYQLFRP